MNDNQYLYAEYDATPMFLKDDYVSMGIGIGVTVGVIVWIIYKILALIQ